MPTCCTAAGGDDILIAGTTDYDDNLIALMALRAEWSRTDLTYQQRIAYLNGSVSGGLNGSYFLSGLCDACATCNDGSISATTALFATPGRRVSLSEKIRPCKLVPIMKKKEVIPAARALPPGFHLIEWLS